MTVTEILSDAYARLNYSASPAAAVTTRLLAFANDTHRELLSMPGMDQLRDDQTSLACIASKARFGLPVGVGRIQAIVDAANQFVLTEVTMAEIRKRNPGGTSTGIPTVFARVGDQGVQRQPSTGTLATLFISSGDAADTTQTVTIQGIDRNGFPSTGSAVLSGATPVVVNMTNGFAGTFGGEITKWYVSAACVGAIALTHNAVVLGTIPVGQTFARYHGLQLDPIPSSAITYTIDYTREIPDLVAGNDEPLLPRDFHRLIGLGIRKREYEKMSDSRYTAVDAQYEEGKRALRSWVQSDGTNTMLLRSRATAMRPSQLGAYYPAGS